RARLGTNLLFGMYGAAILTPLVLGLHLVIVWLYKHALSSVEQEHPLVRLGKQHLTHLEWGLWLFAAIVAAPMIEELLFRGVIQPWAGKFRWGGAVGFVLAGVLAVTFRWDKIVGSARQLQENGGNATLNVLDAFAPLLFVLALSPVLWVAMRR